MTQDMNIFLQFHYHLVTVIPLFLYFVPCSMIGCPLPFIFRNSVIQATFQVFLIGPSYYYCFDHGNGRLPFQCNPFQFPARFCSFTLRKLLKAFTYRGKKPIAVCPKVAHYRLLMLDFGAHTYIRTRVAVGFKILANTLRIGNLAFQYGYFSKYRPIQYDIGQYTVV